MVDISFCIVAYNIENVIVDCLDSLFASVTNLSCEVIIVDNQSIDSTVEIIQNNYPDVKLILNQDNLGYTKAMNQAFRLTNGKYVVQLNGDTVSNINTFVNLYEYMEENPEVGICTPKVLNSDLTLQKQCRRSFARPWDVITYFLFLDRVFPNSKFFGRYLLTYKNDDEIFEVDAVSGSCMFIRGEVLKKVGLLDERYFAYQEDADFCFGVKKAGWKIVYYPKAEIIHFGGLGGSRSKPYRAIYEWHKSYLLYYRKNLAKDYFFLVNWFMYFAMVMKLVLAFITTIFSREKIVGTKKPSVEKYKEKG